MPKSKPARAPTPSPPAPLTGRRARYRGKTAQLNLRLRPQTLARIRRIAEAESLSLADALEFILERSA